MKNFFKHTVGVLLQGGRFIITFLAQAVRLLARSAQTSPADDELSSSIRGGVLNYRTGKFDDGNDPAGWYERD